jgi:hypothetical protein
MPASASNSQAYQLDAYPSGSVSSTGSTSATSGASSIPTSASTTSSSATWTRPTIVQSPGAASSAPSPIVTPPHSPSVVANSPPISPVVPKPPKGKWKKCRTSCCSLNRYTAIAALIIAVLVAYPSFKSWEISKWTARKDFFLYCRENIVSRCLVQRDILANHFDRALCEARIFSRVRRQLTLVSQLLQGCWRDTLNKWFRFSKHRLKETKSPSAWMTG